MTDTLERSYDKKDHPAMNGEAQSLKTPWDLLVLHTVPRQSRETSAFRENLEEYSNNKIQGFVFSLHGAPVGKLKTC